MSGNDERPVKYPHCDCDTSISKKYWIGKIGNSSDGFYLNCDEWLCYTKGRMENRRVNVSTAFSTISLKGIEERTTKFVCYGCGRGTGRDSDLWKQLIEYLRDNWNERCVGR